MHTNASSLDTARACSHELSVLLRKEHGATLDFLLALSSFDEQRFWAQLGYATLFAFLHGELKLSKSAAYYRSAAVALVRKHPEVAEALRDGKLCLSTVGELTKVITPENVRQTLPRFFHLSAREARELVTELAPRIAPPTREVVTTVRLATPPAASAVTRKAMARDAGAAGALADDPVSRSVLTSGALIQVSPVEAAHVTPAPEPAARHRLPVPKEQVEPLTTELRRVHLTVSKRWMEKLQAAKEALSHSIRDRSGEAVLEKALDLLLEHESKRKGLLVNKPRAPRVPSASAKPGATPRPRVAIPAAVRRAVMERDDGQCQFRHHDGTLCGSKVRLQFDHVRPAALGGPPTVENIRLLCASHNDEAARRVYGDEWMDLFRNQARRTPAAAPIEAP